MIAIIDYGVGNLFSLKSSFSYIGEDVTVTDDKNVIHAAHKLILPGVGAFGDAAKKLRDSGLTEVIQKETSSGKPLLGICLGMQMLLEKSYEYGEHEGLGLIPGNVTPIEPDILKGYKIPHIGWNALHFPTDRPKNPLFQDIEEGEFVYFVHSYHGTNCADSIIATTEYGGTLTAAVARENVFGTQFHPEKSGEVGLRILRTFSRL